MNVTKSSYMGAAYIRLSYVLRMLLYSFVGIDLGRSNACYRIVARSTLLCGTMDFLSGVKILPCYCSGREIPLQPAVVCGLSRLFRVGF